MNRIARMALPLALLVHPLICSSPGTRAADEEPITLRAPDGPVWSLSISPDGRTLASCGGYGNGVFLWDITAGKQLATLNDHTERVWRVSISPDGKLLASCSEDGTIILWDLDKRKQLSVIKPASGEVYSKLSFSPDSKGLVSGSSTDSALDYWDVRSGKLQRHFAGHPDETACMTFNDEGNRLAVGCIKGQIAVWNTKTGELNMTLPGHSRAVQAVAFLEDKKELLSVGSDRRLCRWNLDTGKHTETKLDFPNDIRCAAFSHDRKLLAIGDHQHLVTLWDVATGKKLKTFDGNLDPINPVAFSKDGSLLAAGSNKLIKLWKLPAKK